MISRFYGALLAAIMLATVTACGRDASTTGSRPERSAFEEGDTGSRAEVTTQLARVVRGGVTVTDGLVFIARGGRLGDQGGWMALIKAELEVDGEGCLRFASTLDSGSYLPVWPPGYSLVVEGGDGRVLDERGSLVARVGDRVEAGGGEYGRNGTAGGYGEMRRRLGVPERCIGPFWLITPPVEEIARG